MLQRLVLSVTMAGVLVAAGSAQTAKPKTAGPAAKGQAYDVEFVFDNTPYTGTMTLQIAKKSGTVGGKMAITQPTPIDGDVAGTLKGEALSLDYAYTMVQQNCTGRVTVTAKMSPKRDAATGTATSTGCGDGPAEGTFTLKKAAKPTTN